MKTYSAGDTRAYLPFEALIEALAEMFRVGAEVPLRHHHTVSLEEQPDATILLMPAWQSTGFGGVKIVNVNPGNAARKMPALSSAYLLFDAQTGTHVALLDGGEITNRRTAAASALAARYLAKKDASRLLIAGSGRVASNLAYAFSKVRPIKQVAVWDLNPESAENLVNQLKEDGFDAQVVEDLETATPLFDIISCATLATQPIIKGEWLVPGQHLDLIGSFTPKMRETDDQAMQRASVYIDTDSAFSESGDIIDPIKNGVLTKEQVQADLHALCSGKHAGRSSNNEITLFKAVGTALEDLAAATLAFRKISERKTSV